MRTLPHILLFLLLATSTSLAQREWRWEDAIAPGAITPMDVAFNAAGDGFVVCYDGAIYRSTDAGRTWNLLAHPTDSTLRAITFNGMDGLIVGNGVAFRTSDGGDTWQPADTIAHDVVFLSVDMIDSLHAMAVGGGVIARTSDGGRRWRIVHREEIDADVDIGLQDVAMIDTSIALAVGNERLVRTTDGGNSWEATRLERTTLLSVVFIDSSHGISGGARSNGSIFGSPPFAMKTSDGGRTWDQISTPQSNAEYADWISDLEFSDPEYGIAGGLQCMETTDGGATWQWLRGAGLAVQRLALLGDSILIGLRGTIVRGTRGTTTAARETSHADAAIRVVFNAPNPFAHMTTIRFLLPHPAVTTLTITDALGRHVTTLVDGMLEAGEHDTVWNASTEPSGLYFYTLRSAADVIVGRIIHLGSR